MEGCELAIRDDVVGLPAQIAIKKGPERGTVVEKRCILLENLFFSFGVIGTATPVRCSV